MSFVIGRGEGDPAASPSGHIGQYRALDGSAGSPLYLDRDGPHAALVVGKRGYGKSYTMGVIAEELAKISGVSPVVIDPMGVFGGLADTANGTPVPAAHEPGPTISADALDPRSWCALVGLTPEGAAGSLVWQAASDESTLSAMQSYVENADVPTETRRAASNHLGLAAGWGIFDPAGLSAQSLAGPEVTVLDVSGYAAAPMAAVVRAVAASLYEARVRADIDRLPWLLVDEAHTFFDGVAQPALEQVLTRGRAPGVSLVLATQRPSAVSDVAVSQSDILISHRLTSRRDIAALADAQPTYLSGEFESRLPTEQGAVLIVDDTTESIHTARIRSRDTPHDGDSPSASAVDADS